MKPDEQKCLFELWLADHAAVLHHVANGFAEGVDRFDLMQELLVALWRAVPAYRGGARPSTFIYRVAHNAALTWWRTERNYRRRVDRFEADVLHETQTAPAAPARERETLEQVYAHIRRLPPVDRSLICASARRCQLCLHGGDSRPHRKQRRGEAEPTETETHRRDAGDFP